jgi:3-mercaptopyruvate sulfurtransferase SseA
VSLLTSSRETLDPGLPSLDYNSSDDEEDVSMRYPEASLLAAAAALAGAVFAFAQDSAGAPRISLAEMKQLQAKGSVIVVDVRGAEAYGSGHIPGALSMPLDTVARRSGELKAGKKVVTYCA